MNSLNIETFHANIKAQLKTKYPTCFVDYYPRPGDKIKTPALLIDLDDIDPDGDGDIGTEQVAVVIRMNVYCVLPFGEVDQNKLKVRSLAASVLAFVRNKRWDVEIGPAQPDGASPDRFKQGNPPSDENTQEYEVMRVSFSHEAVLGDDVWEYEGEFPTQVFAGIDPKIGEDNEQKYLDVTLDRV